ncbi:MAG: hypothetical protein QHJ82_06695 [Verrucomicrobiota bacterium]|nr:hypothetical protein [Verrucomicrobiota bacterium]
MDDQQPSLRREFWRSPHHIWLGILTLGAGFVIAHPVALLVGAGAYALGWVYLPDMPFFRRWVERRQEEMKRAEESRAIAEFVRKRDLLLANLTPERRKRYMELGAVCRGIESATTDSLLGGAGDDPRLRKLDELMWTYLRLLSIEESLERYLDAEWREDVPGLLRGAEDELERLQKEVDDLKARGAAGAVESRQRLLGSCADRVEVLRKRLERISQARENLALVRSEQDRLDQQIKLIRADAVALKNASVLTARIDATVEHLDQTNKWLAEMDEFRDLVGDMPATERRIGFEPPVGGALPGGAEGSEEPDATRDKSRKGAKNRAYR